MVFSANEHFQFALIICQWRPCAHTRTRITALSREPLTICAKRGGLRAYTAPLIPVLVIIGLGLISSPALIALQVLIKSSVLTKQNSNS